jgi:hypothetical protein
MQSSLVFSSLHATAVQFQLAEKEKAQGKNVIVSDSK